MIDLIKKHKAGYKDEMDRATKDIKEYISKFGNKHCDYIESKRLVCNYNRGAWNALNRIEKES